MKHLEHFSSGTYNCSLGFCSSLKPEIRFKKYYTLKSSKIRTSHPSLSLAIFKWFSFSRWCRLISNLAFLRLYYTTLYFLQIKSIAINHFYCIVYLLARSFLFPEHDCTLSFPTLFRTIIYLVRHFKYF